MHFYYHFLLVYLKSLPGVQNKIRLQGNQWYDRRGFPKVNLPNSFEKDVHLVANSISLYPIAFLATNFLADDKLHFCGIVDLQKALSLICSWIQPSQTSDILRARFEPAQNLIPSDVECCISCLFCFQREDFLGISVKTFQLLI